MKTYRIAQSGLDVSRIAYGCMQLSTDWDGQPITATERVRTAAMVEAAIENGVTLFDHADIYARGKCERLFGELLTQRPSLRQQMVVQSKCGIRLAGEPLDSSPQRYDFSHDHLLSSIEGILQRLGTDHLDILLLHRPDPLVQPEEVARAFDSMRRSGKVRHFGVSNHSAAQIALLQSCLDVPLVVNQVELNLLHHALISDGVLVNQSGGACSGAAATLDYCRQHGILVQAWSPLAGGRLRDSNAPDPALRGVTQCVEQLAHELEVSTEAILLAWLLRHPAGIQPVVGTTSSARLAACCKADAVELSREQWYQLLEAARGMRVP